MREWLLQGNGQILLGVVTMGICLAEILAAFLYGRVAHAAGQLKTTQNQRMRQIARQYESYYRMGMKTMDMSHYVDRCLLDYRSFGVPLISWGRIGQMGTAVILWCFSMLFLGGYLTHLSGAWSGRLAVVMLLCLGACRVFEGVLGLRGAYERIRIQVLDYMENVIHSRLQKEESKPESTGQVQLGQSEAVRTPSQVASAEAQQEIETDRAILLDEILKDYL